VKMFLRPARDDSKHFCAKAPTASYGASTAAAIQSVLLAGPYERISVDSTATSDGMPPEISMADSPARPLEALAQIGPLPLMPTLQAPKSRLQPSPRVL
jgi:hypothetical protein